MLEYLLEKNDGNFNKALIEYKGAKHNMKTVKKSYEAIEQIMRKINKER